MGSLEAAKATQPVETLASLISDECYFTQEETPDAVDPNIIVVTRTNYTMKTFSDGSQQLFDDAGVEVTTAVSGLHKCCECYPYESKIVTATTGDVVTIPAYTFGYCVASQDGTVPFHITTSLGGEFANYVNVINATDDNLLDHPIELTIVSGDVEISYQCPSLGSGTTFAGV